MYLAKLRRNQTGDTIVEVLIVIAIISSVLGGAYAMTNRNVNNNQQAQEHSQALKVAESQLEQLKSYIAAHPEAQPAVNENFCMNLNANTIEKKTFTYTGVGATLPTTDDYYPEECQKNDGRYMTGIKRTGETYTVYISWDGPTNTRGQISLAYKVYP